MRGGLLIVWVLAAGCRFHPGVSGDGAIASDTTSDTPLLPGDGSSGDARPGDATADAIDLCNPGMCTAAGGACMSGTCVITKSGTGDATCPSGSPCKIICTTDLACQSDQLHCEAATQCEIDCLGDHSCSNMGITCSLTGTCFVQCTGDHSCSSMGVTCTSSPSCDRNCCGAHSCSSSGCTGTGCVLTMICP